MPYKKENIPEDVADYTQAYDFFDGAPETRTVIITEMREYENIFPEGEGIDFDNKTAVLYTFASDNVSECVISKLEVNDGRLTVSYRQKPVENGLVLKYQRCFLLTLDKLEFDTVEFIQK